MSGDAHDAGGETEHAEPAEGEHAEAAEGGHSAEAGEAKGGEHAAPAAEHGGGEGERKAEGGHGGGEGEAGGKAAPPPPDPGAGIDFGDTFKLEPFNLNLGNPLENRYVRMEIALEYRGGEGQKVEIEKRLPQLRDAVVSIVSRKTREFLLAPDGKDQLRKEIQTRINRYMAKPIDNVYITDILIE